MKRLFLIIKYFVLVKLGNWKVYPNGVKCCGCGDCKKEVPDEKAESAVSGKICNTCKGNGEWVDVEFREITVCPDCNGTGIISKTCHTYTDTKMPFGIYAPEPDQSKDTERLNTKEQPKHASSYRGKEVEVVIEEAIEG